MAIGDFGISKFKSYYIILLMLYKTLNVHILFQCGAPNVSVTIAIQMSWTQLRATPLCYASDPYKGSGGINVFGLSVRTWISLSRYHLDFYHTWSRGVSYRVDEIIRFWAISALRSKLVTERGLKIQYLTHYRDISRNPVWIFIILYIISYFDFVIIPIDYFYWIN